MGRRFFYLLITLVFVISGCAGAPAKKPSLSLPALPSPQYPQLVPDKGEGEYRYQGQWPVVPSKIKIYKWRRDQVPDRISSLAQRLNMKGPLEKAVEEFPGVIWHEKAGGRLFLPEAGGIHFIGSTYGMGIKDQAPVNREAEQLAKRTLKSLGFLPSHSYLATVDPSYIRPKEGGVGTGNKVIYKEVRFTRLLDNIPDLASRLRVVVGSRKDLVELERNWVQLKEAGVYPIITPQEGLKLLNKGHSWFPGARPGEIKEVKLAYYSLFDQPYLLPVYVFRYKGKYGDQVNVVSAVKGRYLK